MRSPSGSICGRARGRAPVARTICGAFNAVAPPPFFSTATTPRLASPSGAVEHRHNGSFSAGNQHRRDRRFATARAERATTFFASNAMSFAEKPKSSRPPSRWLISEARSSALVGMQPQFRADAAEMFAFDKRRPQTELGGSDGGDVAARPPADDDKIEVGLRHQSSIVSGSSTRPLNAARKRAPTAPSIHPVVARQGAGHDGGDGERAVLDDRSLLAGADRQNARLRRVNHRCEFADAEHPEVGDGEAATGDIPRARVCHRGRGAGEIRHFRGYLREAFVVGIAHHRGDQSRLRQRRRQRRQPVRSAASPRRSRTHWPRGPSAARAPPPSRRNR